MYSILSDYVFGIKEILEVSQKLRGNITMSYKYGWAGKILRVNLTNGTFSTVDTFKYVPKYVGGIGVANRIWWEEVPKGVKAFDPENKLIFMSGPATGTPAPSGGRGEFVTISPHSYPEQYTYSGIGGVLPSKLKWSGYDGIIIEGKSPKPCYLSIKNGEPKIEPCGGIWGMGLVDAQQVLRERHGSDAESYGIGPAGENLVRFAIIGGGPHNACGQGGFGAVMGSKNLKAICVVGGKHQIKVADTDALLKTTLEFGPRKRPVPRGDFDLGDKTKNPWWEAWSGNIEMLDPHASEWLGQMYNRPYTFLCHSCTTGCLGGCGFFEFRNVPAVSRPGFVTGMTGCVHTKYEQFFHKKPRPANWHESFEVHVLAHQLGFGHHEIIYSIVPWLFYTKQMGIDTEKLMGVPTDVRSGAWWIKLFNMIAYRQGFGDQLAEGLRRTVEKLGVDKYWKVWYEGPEACREEAVAPVRTPVAPLGGWGYPSRALLHEFAHPMYIPNVLNWMTDSRDPFHNKWPDWVHDKFINFMLADPDPYNSPVGPDWAKQSTIRGQLVDSLTCCFQMPLRKYMGWLYDYEVGEGTKSTSFESRIYSEVTGIKTTEQEFWVMGERINTILRAILIRNHDRTAKMEWDELVPVLYDTTEPEKLAATVGNFYELMGWDRKTGWPTRAHLESLDMKDVADELQKLGKLPKDKHRGASSRT